MTLTLLITEILLGLLIGLTLGLLGGGGSILTVPALVYLIGQSPQVAVTTSLMMVCTNSSSGAYFHRNQGTLNFRVAGLFGGAGMVMAYLGAGLSSHLSEHTLMIAFAGLMLVVSLVMLFLKTPSHSREECRGLGVILVSGAGVGLLTGFLGVGGGFLIVPALVLLVGLPMRQAIGTSLAVIAMNSLAGFLGHLSSFNVDLVMTLTFVLAGFGGSFIGVRLGKYIPPQRLRVAFASFVMVLAVVLLVDNLGVWS